MPEPPNLTAALPPLLAMDRTASNGPASVGEKLTTISAVPFGGTVNEPPETTAKESPLTEAEPLNAVPPVLATVKVHWELDPAATAPKSQEAGLAVSAAGTLAGSNGSEPNWNSSKFE